VQDVDVDRELRNWALWHESGGWLGLSASTVSGIYAASGPRYREAAVPIMAGAAWDVDTIVAMLTRELREAIHAWYLRLDPLGRRIPGVLTTAHVARVLHCAERTYRRRVDLGRRSVGEELAARRRRTRMMRAAAEA
jgi:hypothetical protein